MPKISQTKWLWLALALLLGYAFYQCKKKEAIGKGMDDLLGLG
jgi:hypothetical protein